MWHTRAVRRSDRMEANQCVTPCAPSWVEGSRWQPVSPAAATALIKALMIARRRDGTYHRT